MEPDLTAAREMWKRAAKGLHFGKEVKLQLNKKEFVSSSWLERLQPIAATSIPPGRFGVFKHLIVVVLTGGLLWAEEQAWGWAAHTPLPRINFASVGSPAWYLEMVPPACPCLYPEVKHHVFILTSFCSW